MNEVRETARLQALHDYAVLDTAPDEAFDRLTALAADLFDAPIALVSLIDSERQWFKSRQGLDATETPRSLAFCAHAIEREPGTTFVVEDASRDPRFATNPLVTGDPNIRFYAGALLTSPDGHNLGTLCVIDDKPRPALTPLESRRLQKLAQIVVDEMELKRASRQARESERLLDLAERMSGVGHWRYLPANGRLEWSDEIYRTHGVSRETYDPNLDRALGFYDDEVRAEIDLMVARAIETGEGYEFEYPFRRADGSLRQCACKAACELDATGKVIALTGVFQDVTEQRHAMAQLSRSEARYRLLADNAADAITRIRLDGSSNYISAAIENVLGYTPAEMAAKRAAGAYIYPPHLSRLTDAFAALSKGVDNQTIEHQGVHKDGHLVWLETRLKLVRTDEGAPKEIVAIIRDIGERKALEEATARARDEAQEQARRAALAEGIAGLGHWRLDLATGEVALSDQLAKIYRLPAGRKVDLQVLSDMVHPDDKEASKTRLASYLEGDKAANRSEVRIVDATGQIRHLASNGAVERGPDGKVVAIVGTIMDITEQREAAAALAESELRYRRLADTAPDIIAEGLLDGTMTYLSPAALKLTGYTPEELVGRTSYEFMHPDDAPNVVNMFVAVMESKGGLKPWPVQFRATHKAGHEIWLESTPTPVTDPLTGEVVGLTDIIRDVTDRKVMEAELRDARIEAEAAAAVKGEFLANMSHELRTPLTSIVGFTKLAAEQPDLTELSRTYVERVGDASQALLATVNDILDFSKLEAGQVAIQPRPVVLSDLTRSSLALFTPQAGAKDLDLRSDFGPASDLALNLDPDRIRQILLNLVGNAVKFTSTGGVTLRTRYDAQTSRLRIEIIDTGAGISAEKQDLLFKRFSQVDGSLTRAHGGTGLGLAICKGLVEAMGGEIGIKSREGVGSTFWFELPAAPAAAQSSSPSEVEQMTFSGVRVLVADDHPANRELVKLFLAGVGAEVSEAEDGRQAVRMAAEMPYDVILMDVRMPHLDGPGALREIRAASGPNDATPILAFTADADPNSAEALIREGFDDVVTKPVDAGGLIRAVARASAFGETPQDQRGAYAG